MKIGDKVICILDGPWMDTINLEIARHSFHPKKDDILTIHNFYYFNGEQFIQFVEIPNLDDNGERAAYDPLDFRKLEPNYTNHLTKELAHKVLWDQFKIRDLQYQELKIFTTKSDF
jgi:hypothetical protein